MLQILGYAAAGCLLAAMWGVVVLIGIVAVLVVSPDLLSDDQRLSAVADYTALVTIFFASGALVLGGVAGTWAGIEFLVSHLGRSAM